MRDDEFVDALVALIRRGRPQTGAAPGGECPRAVRVLLEAWAGHRRPLVLGEWELESLGRDARGDLERAGGSDLIGDGETVLGFASESSVTLVVAYGPERAGEFLYELDFEYQRVRPIDRIADWLRRLVEGEDDVLPAWKESLEDALEEEQYDTARIDRMPELRLRLAERVEELRAAGDRETADRLHASLDVFRSAYGSLHHPWPDPDLTT